MKSPDEIDHLIVATKSELAELENRRSELLAHLAELQREKEVYVQSGHHVLKNTAGSWTIISRIQPANLFQ